MPDITMCTRLADGCSLARFCRRSEASGTTASKWQSWSRFGPPGARCDHFWLVTSTDGLPAEPPDDACAPPGTPTARAETRAP